MECLFCCETKFVWAKVSCGCQVCVDCMHTWFVEHRDCPLCRSPCRGYVVDIIEMVECSICLNLGIFGAQRTECGHTFCQGCLSQWLKQHDNCPICRSQVGEPLYEVDRIVDVRGSGLRVEFLVQWKAGDFTWEPLENLQGSELALQDFWNQLNLIN